MIIIILHRTIQQKTYLYVIWTCSLNEVICYIKASKQLRKLASKISTMLMHKHMYHKQANLHCYVTTLGDLAKLHLATILHGHLITSDCHSDQWYLYNSVYQ